MLSLLVVNSLAKAPPDINRNMKEKLNRAATHRAARFFYASFCLCLRSYILICNLGGFLIGPKTLDQRKSQRINSRDCFQQSREFETYPSQVMNLDCSFYQCNLIGKCLMKQQFYPIRIKFISNLDTLQTILLSKIWQENTALTLIAYKAGSSGK